MKPEGEADWRILPLGDRALIVAFEARVDPAVNRRVRAAAAQLSSAAIAGVVDVVPAFCTVAVHYRPEQIGFDQITGEQIGPQQIGGQQIGGQQVGGQQVGGTRIGYQGMAGDPAAGWVAPFDRLVRRIERVLASASVEDRSDERTVRIPVCYGGRHGPDLEAVAAATGLSPDAVIAAHVGSDHRVYMLGFSPGFPYIGGLDPRLSMPRRKTPRTRIPAGTVAIARDQSAIYTFETPGGWNLIGRTPVVLFDSRAEPPCLLQAGDRIAFEPIDEARFDALVAAGRDGLRPQPT